MRSRRIMNCVRDRIRWLPRPRHRTKLLADLTLQTLLVISVSIDRIQIGAVGAKLSPLSMKLPDLLNNRYFSKQILKT